MDDTTDVLGGNPADYQPKVSKEGRASLEAGAKVMKEMGEAVEDAQEESTKVEVNTQNSKPVATADFTNAKKLLRKGQLLYRVKNDSDAPLVTDWCVPMLPEDMHAEMKSYLKKKYVQYGFGESIQEPKTVAILVQGRTVNFLFQYMTENDYPTIVALPEGREIVSRSRFILRPGEVILMNEEQLDGIRQYQKIKKEYPTEEGPITSDWMGFLLFTPVSQDKPDFDDIERVFCTRDDLLRTGLDISKSDIVIKRRKGRGAANITEATE